MPQNEEGYHLASSFTIFFGSNIFNQLFSLFFENRYFRSAAVHPWLLSVLKNASLSAGRFITFGIPVIDKLFAFATFVFLSILLIYRIINIPISQITIIKS